MNTKRLATSLRMHLRMLLRRKIVLVLLFVIPSLFLTVVKFTSTMSEVRFQLGMMAGKTMVSVPQRDLAMVFVMLASTGFLASFLAMNLVQQYGRVNRRLVACGYHPGELILSGFTVMLFMIALTVGCTGSAIMTFVQPHDPGHMLTGFLLTGLIYGSYGVLVGSLVEGELEGVLLVVVLANIDVGWLQNPLFFSHAQNKFIIRLLPGYHSTQVAVASAFTDFKIHRELISSVCYACLFLCAAVTVSFYRMRRSF